MSVWVSGLDSNCRYDHSLRTLNQEERVALMARRNPALLSLRLTLLAPAVIEKLLANTDPLINLESVLRRVMPIDWQAQGAAFARA